jgi:hypothetical protein
VAVACENGVYTGPVEWRTTGPLTADRELSSGQLVVV